MKIGLRAGLLSIALSILSMNFLAEPAAAASSSGVVALSASSYQVSTLAGTIVVPVNRSGGSAGTASVQYTTLAGTATFSTDYSGEHGVLTWASGDTAPKSIKVRIYSAGAVSGSKQFYIKLSNAVGATLGAASATVTIAATAASASVVSLPASSFSVVRSSTYLTVSVARSGNVGSAGAVNYQTKLGTAVYGVDYDGVNGVLTWSAGDALPKTFKVRILAASATGTRAFSLQLFSPSGVSLGSPSTASVTISPPTVAVVPAVPTGLSAAPGKQLVTLNWSPSNGAPAYHVKRATTNGGTYTQVAAPTAAAYSDTSVTDGTKYFYVVSAVNSVGESANSAPVSALPAATTPVSGSTGTWVNVTPASVTLTGALSCGNYGTETLQVDPARPSNLYTEFNCQGIYKSTDYGATWTGPINTGTNGALVTDCAGGITVSPISSGSAPTIYESCIRGSGTGFWKSVDGGVNWTRYSVAPSGSSRQDYYPPVVDPYNENHLLMAGHEMDYLVESIDGGKNWTSISIANGMLENGGTGAIFFINTGAASTTAATWLWMAQQSGGTYGTWRSANAGSSWVQVDKNEHPHGASQMYQPDTSGIMYMAGAYSALGWGVLRSTDYGKTWAHVGAVSNETVVFGTSKNVYSMFGYPIGIGGVLGPAFELTTQPGTTGWSSPGTPSGLTQGAGQIAVVNDGTHNIFVGAMWNSGVWRYIEP